MAATGGLVVVGPTDLLDADVGDELHLGPQHDLAKLIPGQVRSCCSWNLVSLVETKILVSLFIPVTL